MARSFRPLTIIIGAAIVLLVTCSAPLRTTGTQPMALVLPTATVVVLRATALPEASAVPEQAPIATQAPTPPPIVPTATSAPLVAQFIPTPHPDQLSQQIDTYANDLVKSGWFSGAILVARNNQVIFSKGYGMADSERGITNTPQTRFRLASLSKQFTATGIMLLVSQGKLSLTDSICSYIDNCPTAWQPVQVRHLLNHTSGIVDYTDFLDFEDTEMLPATPQELMARFRNYPLAYTPGELYDYCNSGYVLLGMIIERVSGQSYGDFLQSAIFRPLGMQSSGYDTRSTPSPEEAAGYSSFTEKSSFLNTTTLFAAGGLYSTVEDMYRWDQALYTEQLLPKNLLDEMFIPGNGSYGYGWKILRPNGRLQISHAGNMTGVSTFIARYPEDRITIIVLSNLEFANTANISDYIASLLFTS